MLGFTDEASEEFLRLLVLDCEAGIFIFSLFMVACTTGGEA